MRTEPTQINYLFTDERFFSGLRKFCYIIVGILVCYTTAILFVGPYVNLLVHAMGYLQCFLLIRFINKKQYHIAKWISAIGWALFISVACLVIGAKSNFDLAFFISASYSLLLFKRGKAQNSIFLLNILLFLLVRFWYAYNGQLVDNSYFTFYLANSLVVFGGMYLLQRVYLNTIHKYQQEVEEKTRALSRLNQELDEKVRTRTQELEDKNQHLNELYENAKGFTHIVSHDLKEPLRSIVSFSQLIKRRIGRKDYENVEEYAEFISQSARRLNQLMDDVLRVYTLDKGLSTLESLDLRDIIKQVRDDLRPVIHDQGARIELTASTPIVMGNANQLSLLLNNLISNSIKFRSEQLIKIRITYRANESHHIIGVDDNGQGIPKEYQGYVFEMFKRLENKLDSSGSGIGLAVCKKIAILHGGDIWINDKEAPGTFIEFSIAKSPSAAPANTSSAERVGLG